LTVAEASDTQGRIHTQPWTTMKLSPLLLAMPFALSLAACDQPKNRPAPAPAAPAVTAAPAPAAPVAMSDGLVKRPEFPGFYLDQVGLARDPLNKQPAVTPAGQPTVLSGFGYDTPAKLPAKGVDVAIDGKAYATTYGQPRQDVATFTKVPALVPVGFTLTLPAGALAAGDHTAVVRVIAADGQGYFESPPIKFQVQ
jgi:hypothetical protein